MGQSNEKFLFGSLTFDSGASRFSFGSPNDRSGGWGGPRTVTDTLLFSTHHSGDRKRKTRGLILLLSEKRRRFVKNISSNLSQLYRTLMTPTKCSVRPFNTRPYLNRRYKMTFFFGSLYRIILLHQFHS